jgi:branched-chain amino acid transport system permease protein
MLHDIARNLRELGWAWRLGIAAALGFVVAYSVVGAPYYQSLLLSIAMYVVLCSSWNVISGFTGYVSFGHVVFWGLGAYLTAILINHLSWPWPLALLGAGLGTAGFAALVSYPLLRLSGVYFAIAMLALAEAVGVMVAYARPVTGGGGGIYLRPLVGVDDAFLMMGLLAVGLVVLVAVLQRTRFIQSLLAIRGNELAAGALGIPATQMKMRAFVFSAFFPGLAGGIYILNVAFIDPRTALDIGITLNIILMTVFGGIGTVLGPVVGPFIFMALSEVLWAQFPFVHKALLGVIIVLLVLFLPRGVLPSLDRLLRRRRAALR